MSAFLASIGLPEVVAGLVVVALTGYALTGGADFGGGVWDLLATGPRADAQRRLIADSIAPIWEANHVWLIVVVVMLFTGFPAAFGTITTILHVPLTILLVGIVLRGSAFVFRSYGPPRPSMVRRWSRVFSVASVVSPVCLGAVIGALSSGAVGTVARQVGQGSFAAVYVSPWLAAFPILVGLLALALFAMLAAVYLTLEADTDDLREDFRRRAIGSAIGVGVLAGATLLVARGSAPLVAGGVAGSSWSWVLHLMTAVAALTVFAALWRRRYRVARVAAGAQVTFILWGWALSQYPYVVPSALTIRQAAAPRETLVLLVIGLVVGAAILIPSLRFLYRTFTPLEDVPTH